MFEFEKALGTIVNRSEVIYIDNPDEPDNQVLKVTSNYPQAPGTYAVKISSATRQEWAGQDQHTLYAALGDQGREKHLITPFAYYEDPTTHALYNVMPYIKGKTIDGLLDGIFTNAPDGTHLGFAVAYSFAEQMGIAYQYLRDHNFLHGDINADNRHFWVTAENEFFLLDFELAVQRSIEKRIRELEVVENVRYFELVMQLLLPRETTLRRKSEIYMMDFVLFSRIKENQVTGRLLRECDNMIAKFERKTGKTVDKLLAEYSERMEKHGLMFLVNELKDVLTCFSVAKQIDDIKERYGGQMALIFRDHIHQALIDPNYQFADFSAQLDSIQTDTNGLQ